MNEFQKHKQILNADRSLIVAMHYMAVNITIFKIIFAAEKSLAKYSTAAIECIFWWMLFRVRRSIWENVYFGLFVNLKDRGAFNE